MSSTLPTPPLAPPRSTTVVLPPESRSAADRAPTTMPALTDHPLVIAAAETFADLSRALLDHWAFTSALDEHASNHGVDAARGEFAAAVRHRIIHQQQQPSEGGTP